MVMPYNTSNRPKTFVTMESLFYEEERLATYIDWPLNYISSLELAADGFYFLRTKDHCACAFCRGIIGSWESGDTPRGEHMKHFPQCPFVQGKVTANVPISMGKILARYPKKKCTNLDKSLAIQQRGEDICGNMSSIPNNKDEIPQLTHLGLKQYSGPKSKEYLTIESRIKSFKCDWPEKVVQTPEQLATAGFYYCNLSDHVRCFHCGNGLRNWEAKDDPWIEHARWYPDCHFVILEKGLDFIEKVEKDHPPYYPFRAARYAEANPYSEKEELDQLLKLPIMKELLAMGFSENTVRTTLKRQLETKGVPFFSLKVAIDCILVVMDEETRQTIRGCEQITSQARQMSQQSENNSSENTSTSTEESSIEDDTPTSRSSPVTVFSGFVRVSSPPLRASTPTEELNVPQPMESSNTEESIPIIRTESETSSSSEESSLGTLSGSEEMTIEETNLEEDLKEASENIEKIDQLLAAPSINSNASSRNSVASSQDSGIGRDEPIEESTPPPNEAISVKNIKEVKTRNIEEELESLKERSLCKICMDKEMNIVFLPCTHMVTCASCATALAECPICRRNIQYAFKPIIT